jgi:hypothetical protein
MGWKSDTVCQEKKKSKVPVFEAINISSLWDQE